MANGQFPVTYDVAADATGYAHEDVNALISLQELKQPITRGRMMAGEEIDFGKYKRLDIGGE